MIFCNSFLCTFCDFRVEAIGYEKWKMTVRFDVCADEGKKKRFLYWKLKGFKYFIGYFLSLSIKSRVLKVRMLKSAIRRSVFLKRESAEVAGRTREGEKKAWYKKELDLRS